ncbi:HAMP domain-containing protein [Pseudoflavitalea sp. X16]|uniref:sensor histidine kinase n=1 Tax=Paraflavitalea devenefica TaxID=2716334 RepID=UPI00141EB94E|nr:ATP-binding protein [Paraflavitalea devenefica]NII23987.1 HAMP domain-containing protein [Paraflavitalea devenefica]
MGVRLKTKLSLGLGFLFLVILTFGILSLYYINRLSSDANRILKNNYESLVYSNNMLGALEDLPDDSSAITVFRANLRNQEANITEPGEREVTESLQKNFQELLANPEDSSNYVQVRESIRMINDLNQEAILKKNAIAGATAESAKLWLTIIFTTLILIVLTFIYNFPGVIAEPVAKLADGIREIANKNYGKRIYLKQEDEFGELAQAFNSMAGKLDEYENSNLAKLTFEKKRIETIINQMRDGIIGLDEKGHLLFLNAVAEKLLGLKEADILGKYAPDLALKNDLMRTLLQEEGTKKELKIYADNKESYFNKDVLHVVNNGQVAGKVIVLRNITLFHELNEAKTNFIATVSHELKTPLSSIKMSAQLLTDNRVGQLNTEQQELTKSISEDADRLLNITSELLNMSQVETGNIQLKLQPARPAAIIEQAVQAVQFQAQQKNITLRTNLPEDLPAVQADKEKTSWVIINFLTNAIRYSPDTSFIDIAAYHKDNKVFFTVTDYGRGIDEKYLPRIFDRYFKVPGTHERNGTGLGLAISKEFIEAQGGAIWVKSRIGEGSLFGFHLSQAK